MNLRKLIEVLRLTGTASEIVTALNTKNIKVPISKRVTWADLAARFGTVTVNKWDTKLKQAGMDWIRQALSGSGIDLSHPESQKMLEEFQTSGLITQQEKEQLRSLGEKTISLAEQHLGEGRVLTLDEVEKALAPQTIVGRQVIVGFNIIDGKAVISLNVQDITSDGYSVHVDRAMLGSQIQDNHPHKELLLSIAQQLWATLSSKNN